LCWIVLLALAGLLAGCGYTLGPTNHMTAGARSLGIRPFVNNTHEPRLTEYLAMSLRRQVQVDGTFHLETAGSPDIWVTGEIKKYDRTPLSYATNDILTPQEYVLGMDTHVVAREASTGRVVYDQVIHGTSYLRIGEDLAAAEREAIPVLTDVVARTTVDQLADGKW
jgi:hypothetical protein